MTMTSKEQKINILAVDDRPENLMALEKILDRDDVNFVKALSGNDALGLLLGNDFALILLDVQMPEMDGFETAELIRGTAETSHIPIIFVTAISKDPEHIFKGYEIGAVDYLLKPLNPDIIRGKVSVFLDLYRHQRDIEKKSLELKKTVGELETSQQVIEEQNKILRDLSIKDGLTGLFNHRHMENILEQEFSRAQRYHTNLSCLIMDLDYFKNVNDMFGHTFGDFVLKEFASRLIGDARESDVVFRYGGEEFLVLLPQSDMFDAENAAEKFRKVCEETPFDDGSHVTSVTVSIGTASLHEHHPLNHNDLLAFADKALYRAKSEGRNRVRTYLGEQKRAYTEKKGEKGRDINYLKEHLASVLDRTKKSCVSSIEFLAKNSINSAEKHSYQALRYISDLGSRLHFSEDIVMTFQRAAILHDSFNTFLSRFLFYKADPLTSEERADVKKQPYMLAELTEHFDFFADEKSILLYHHENYDGSGYPEGLKGEQIPIGARIFSIVDALVAMTSEKPYRQRLSAEQVLSELAENAGAQFDPALVLIFLDIINEDKNMCVNNDAMANAKEKVMSKIHVN